MDLNVTAVDIERATGLDMATKAAAIPSSVSVLTCHGTDDETIPCDDAMEYDGIIKTHTLR